MKPKLSIIVPTIRPNRWVTFYDSIKNNISYPFEVILAGPHSLIPELQHRNIKVIRDFGSPVRARQMCIHLAEADLITWASDDSVYLPNVLNEVIETFPYENYKHVQVGTYIEGQNGTNKTIQNEGYWKLNNAYPKSKFVSDDWYIFNTAFMTTKFLTELGGFDCELESCACADADLAVRAYKAGATVSMLKNMVVDTDWAPGIDGYGDHRPLWDAQTNHDMALYEQIHNDDALKNRINVSLDNWKKAETIWSRRFK